MANELYKTVGGLHVYEIKRYLRLLSDSLDARVNGDYELELVHLAQSKKESAGALTLSTQAIQYGRERGLDMDAFLTHHQISISSGNILDEFYIENYQTISRDGFIDCRLYSDARDLAQKHHEWQNNIKKD